MKEGFKMCKKCYTSKPIEQFNQHPTTKDRLQSRCKQCSSTAAVQSLRAARQDPQYRLWHSSRCRARAHGMEHTIQPADIYLPEVCKYLGVTINYQLVGEDGRVRSQDGPSIDRIDSTKGYVPGNIQVISDLANRMKQEATVEQLLAFAAGITRLHG